MSSRRKVILVVEDYDDLRSMFRSALVYAGFDVLEAADGLHALRLIDAQEPDLVVLDLGLPLVDGYAVAQELAAHAHIRRIPVVVVTAAADVGALEVDCVLQKPVRPEDLVATVRRCLAAGPPLAGS